MFRDFYSSFSETFRRKHIEVIEGAEHEAKGISEDEITFLKARPPLFWKTVGDEIIFVNRVDSCFEVFLLTRAFVAALQDYGVSLSGETETETLGVKGAGWIASFPYPNIAIEMPRQSAASDDGLSEREEIELKANSDPATHEFLGKGLDYGFRIAGNSANDFMAISPALADVIARANVNEDYAALGAKIRVKPPLRLKGVLDGKAYPVIGIPVDKTKKWSEFRELQDKLLGSDQSNDQELRKYFRHFMELHDIEEPCLTVRPGEASPNPPKYYLEKYVPKWKEAKNEVADQDTMISEGEKVEDNDGNEPSEQVTDRILRRLKTKNP